jgi:YVTN family beta-propeller protein
MIARITRSLLALLLVLAGCGSGDNFRDITAADLENMTFTFADGRAFGFAGQQVTLTFGDFDDDGDNDPNTGPFALQVNGTTIAGTITLGSCRYDVASSPDDNLPPGSTILHDPCSVNPVNGVYRGTNTTLQATAESNAAQNAQAPTFATPSRSTSIAATSDDRRVVVVNRETDTVSVIEVRDQNGNDAFTKLAEIAVGREPRYVAISPDNTTAYVTNAASGTVSVIQLTGVNAFKVIATITVGSEPRGCILTPNGTQLYVANFTSGTVSVIDTASRAVVDTITLGGNPMALAITNDGDTDDTDERIFVTQFFAELITGGSGEGRDDGKQGVVQSFAVADPATITRITLSPLANVGFTADRTEFCPQSRTNANPLHSTLFCPDLSAAAGSTTITQDPQGAFPNQLQSALIRDGRVYLPNIGAGPEPPVRFNVNIQALVHVVEVSSLTEQTALHVNLNDQIKTETAPADPTTSLDRIFGNDLVAIDAYTDGSTFLVVSRGGNYVMKASLDTDNTLSLGAPTVVRFQTGNIPNGVVISRDERRAYAYNEVGCSVTAMHLSDNSVVQRDIEACTPAAPGTFEHAVLLGKLAFFTALGLPNDGIFDLEIRDIVPLTDRGKASDNGWSSCGSCHPDGLTDGVTWLFPTGPRQTVPLDGFFSKDNPGDQRISNWSAVRGSITDFNNNSRNVQGGLGFAGNPPNPNIYNHGITQGASDALDVMTLWVQTVRALLQPQTIATATLTAGRTVFEARCATCHGGAKWTKSQVLYQDNPAFDSNPLGTPAGVPFDPGITNAGPQIRSFTKDGETINFLETIGTFNAADPLELRGTGGAIGATALGGLGFNVPSLLGVHASAPYLHNGAAQTLDTVFTQHNLDGGTIATVLSAAEQQDVQAFLRTIDGRTDPFRSAADDFRDATAD